MGLEHMQKVHLEWMRHKCATFITHGYLKALTSKFSQHNC